MKNKVKLSTILRLVGLAVAIVNLIVAEFLRAKGIDFEGSAAYEIISIIATVAMAGINAWYNNDITAFAKVAGRVFDALRDGKITIDEVQAIIGEFQKDTKEMVNDVLDEEKDDDKDVRKSVDKLQQ